jgi:hypothetical protein
LSISALVRNRKREDRVCVVAESGRSPHSTTQPFGRPEVKNLPRPPVCIDSLLSVRDFPAFSCLVGVLSFGFNRLPGFRLRGQK